jgi:hypothetical protein
VIGLVSKVTELERIVSAQCKEIGRLKGMSDCLNIKPSGMEKGT